MVRAKRNQNAKQQPFLNEEDDSDNDYSLQSQPQPPPRRGPNHYQQRGGYAPPPPSSSNKNAPLFTSSSFPAPLPPRVSRANPPILHYDTSNPGMLIGGGRGTTGRGRGVTGRGMDTRTNAGGGRNISSSSGVKFRSAESTQRTMNELAQKRHEKAERKRAGTLLISMVCLALGVHFVTSESPMFFGGFYEVENGGEHGGGVNPHFQSLRSKEYGVVVPMEDEKQSAKGDVDGIDDLLKKDKDGDKGGGDGDKDDSELFDGNKYDDEENYLPPVEEEKFEEGEEYLIPVRYYSDIKSPRRRSDSPFFFHIPRCGGQTVKDIVGKCLGLSQASNMGVQEGHGNDPQLAVVNLKDARYVNVDTTSIPGIERAIRLGLTKSKMADLITSSLFHDAADLFTLEHQGRAFTMLRHPVERAVSMYYYRTRGENADIDPSVTLEDYARGEGIENNWLTRFLTDRMEGELLKEDLDNAMDILSRKFLIGFLDDGEESIARMMKYFGWTYAEDSTKKMLQEDCVKELIDDGTNRNIEGYELPKKGTQAYALISWQTQFDVKLYEYALGVFETQTKHWGTKARKKALKKKKGGK
uniref:Sulfotransferase domain-containing protein n=1 Tax=Ditylum brightwellii TaxID=49249 RepID=A0A7S4UT07_9STRA|mmetsp:Transcript_21515/g.28304  ORF Transcript_21515/g.28304 Transcript_21515/m.28304 type:complete len:584 (-) Transcript_21515:168-1919(-)